MADDDCPVVSEGNDRMSKKHGAAVAEEKLSADSGEAVESEGMDLGPSQIPVLSQPRVATQLNRLMTKQQQQPRKRRTVCTLAQKNGLSLS